MVVRVVGSFTRSSVWRRLSAQCPVLRMYIALTSLSNSLQLSLNSNSLSWGRLWASGRLVACSSRDLPAPSLTPRPALLVSTCHTFLTSHRIPSGWFPREVMVWDRIGFQRPAVLLEAWDQLAK